MVRSRPTASARRIARRAWVGWLLAMPGLGCAAREEVDLDPLSIDASSASGVDGGARPDASAAKPIADASLASSQACAVPDSRACAENGGPCEVATECCSLRCVDGDCLAPGSCIGPWGACTTRAQCCSGRCEPIPETTYRMCLDYCLPNGAPCLQALDCCSTGCHDGTCAPQVCAAAGEPCTANADCCSGLCPAGGGQCVRDLVWSCAPPGETCGVSGAAPCCDTCDTASGTCAFGAGPCLEVGVPCIQDADCCRGTCTPNAAGIAVCTAPCLPTGGACASSPDCCLGRCTGLPATCAPIQSLCRPLGAACDGSDDCCSSQCIDGVCASECNDL
jgi:hypothetical protein